jgi:lysophospholipid acyltransferase (LPLAT)-like uncharacterized protein
MSDKFVVRQGQEALAIDTATNKFLSSKGWDEEVVIDPFGTAMQWIAHVLEATLDDGVAGAMSETEYAILEKIATIVTQEAGLPVEPRAG